MTQIVKLFLPNDFHEELLYQYEDKDADLRKLIFGFLKPLAKQGKMVKLNKTIQARVMKDGKMAMEDKELKDLDLEKHAVVSNAEWIPDKVTKDEIKIYELTISDKLFEDLEYFGKIFCARLDIWNENLGETEKEQEAKFPSCFEQIIQDNVVGALSQALATNIDKDYDEDFEELEKAIKDKQPPKRD